MDFLKQIAGASPLPAGGAAAASASGLAIGLINKIILLEIHRQADSPEIEKNLLTAKKELERLLKDVEKLIGEDAEKYKRFDQSRRAGDQTQMKHDFNRIIEVSMKVLEKSDSAFEWIKQLHAIVPKQMTTHLLVACELIMGSIRGTEHVAKDNLQSIKEAKKRNNYLTRVNDLQKVYQKKYFETIEQLK